MFSVYLDDSGTDPNQQVAIASALVVPAIKIGQLEKEWKTFVDKYEIPEFHTSECVAGNKPPYEGWSEEKKEMACARVRQITMKYASRAFSFAVNKPDYEAVLPSELRVVGGEYHYTWAVRHLVSALRNYAQKIDLKTPYEYIFDSMGKNSKNLAKQEIEILMEQAEEVIPGHFKGHYGFRNRRDLPALQCADMLAWTCYQFTNNAFFKTPLKPIAEEGFWEFDRYKNKSWITAITLTRENLKDWADREVTDPQAVKRRSDWLRRHPLKRGR